jgi:hypothetical protein
MTTTTAPADARRAGAARLARLADGYLVTQLLHVAVALGVPDALVAGPLSADDLAERVGAVPGPLRRVLRGLAAEEVLEELPDGRFGLTAAAELLCGGAPDSLQGMVAVRGELYYRMLAGLLDAVRDGGVPFEVMHGRPFFEFLAGNARWRTMFQEWMAARSAREADAVVAGYEFGRFASIVDVGGGTGTLLRAVRERAPNADLVLFDRPEVVAATDLPAVGGDFFVAVPAGADAYLLSRVLHDWDDAAALRILRTCRAAMRPDSVLVAVEMVLPDRAVDDPAAVRFDLHMLALLGGCERTADQFAALLGAAGLRLAADIPTPAGVHVLEARVG